MRIAIVTGVVVPRDAISIAVVGQARTAATIPGVESVTVFAQHIEGKMPCTSHVITDPWRLFLHPDFATADVVIFHWGIHYQLFDVITLRQGLTGRHSVVHFHNCTPRELVEEDDRELIDRSLIQLHHAIALGLRFWTFSDFNVETLLMWGVDESDVAFVPFPIDVPTFDGATRTLDRVELLTVGRRVSSKGLNVLIEALGLLGDEDRDRVHLRIAGSAAFSSPEYVKTLEALIERHELSRMVDFVDDPTEDELWDLYRRADVVVSASLHEGLCVPIIEGYAFGCRAIGTTAGNLAYAVRDPDPRVPPNDPQALSAAIHTMVEELRGVTVRNRLHAEFVDRYSVTSSRKMLQRELYRLVASAD